MQGKEENAISTFIGTLAQISLPGFMVSFFNKRVPFFYYHVFLSVFFHMCRLRENTLFPAGNND